MKKSYVLKLGPISEQGAGTTFHKEIAIIHKETAGNLDNLIYSAWFLCSLGSLSANQMK